MTKWGGRRAQAWTAAVLARYGTVCHLRSAGCTYRATTGDHLVPRSVRPDLQYVVENGRPACASCNFRRKAKALAPRHVVDDTSFFESATAPRKDPAQSPPRASENLVSHKEDL